MTCDRKRVGLLVCLMAVFMTGAYFRASGLFRGLEEGVVFHPDSPKQVMALHNYLEGNYVQYYDNIFYDGYPYGLNRVDELVLRVWRAVADPLRQNLYAQTAPPRARGRVHLYYYGRVLRVLYGLLVMGLLYGCGKILLGGWYGLGAAALYGVAPLASTVTHSVTGDIGVDLFLALLLFCGARFVDGGKRRWFFLMGAACGMGFVCKFQGLLGIWIVLLLAAASAWHAGRIVWKRTWQSLLLGLAGFVGGALLLNPAFLIDPTRTWRYMRLNFVFIKNYRVPAEFLALPLHEKVLHGLRTNLFPTIGHVGIVFFILAAIVLVMVLVAFVKAWQRREPVAPLEFRKLLFGFGVTSFAFGALVLATSLKQVVQPFHFSFLLPPLALAGIWGLNLLCIHGKLGLRLLAGCLFVLAAGELLVESVREDYFWRRPENIHLGVRFAEAVAGAPNLGSDRDPGHGISNLFYTEPAVKPVFRNRPSRMLAPTQWWASHETLPYPPIPYPGGLHWIFMHGADYPRSARMFEVPAGHRVQRTLVYQERPAEIRLGLQTGYRPARFSVKARGGQTIRGFLPQHGQQIVTLRNLRADYMHDGGTDLARAIGMQMTVESDLGPVWVTVLGDDDLAQERFLFYGISESASSGSSALAAFLASQDPHVLADALSPTLYYAGNTGMTISGRYAALPGSAQMVLAAGAYVLRLDLEDVPEANRLYIRIVRGNVTDERLAFTGDVESGPQTFIWKFSKDFAPFDGVLEIRADQPGVHLSGWELKPDPEGMRDFAPGRAAAPWSGPSDLQVAFPGFGNFQGLAVTLEGSIPRYALRFDLNPAIRPRDYSNAVFFLHVKSEQGEVVAGWDIPLWATTLSDDSVQWHMGEALPTGRYHVDGGLYHARNRLRFRFRAPKGVEPNPRRKYVRLAEFDVP